MYLLFIQFIGAIAFVILALSYFKKEKKQILFLQIIAYIFFTIHYYLLSGVTGAVCNLIGLFALIAIYLFERNNWNYTIIPVAFFAIVLMVVNISTYQNTFSIFPMIASVSVILSFLTEKADIIRGVGLVSAVCWLIYAIAYKSYISIVFETLTFIGTSIAFFKNTSNPEVKIEIK